MKIIYLNAWHGAIKDRLLEFIKNEASSTDIFCFQEASDDMEYIRKDALLGYREISDYKSLSENHDFSQSIFLKNDIELVSSGLLLTNNMEAGLANYVEVIVGDSNLYICNVHGISYPGDKLDTPGRLKQSTELIEFFKNKDAPAIIGGDFNILPDATSIEMFSEHNYRDLVKEFQIDTTRNDLAWDRYPDNKQYYSDYVFLNDKISCKGFNVPKVAVSDHLPLILEI